MTTAGSDTTALALTARLRLREEDRGATCARPHRGAGGLAEPVWQTTVADMLGLQVS